MLFCARNDCWHNQFYTVVSLPFFSPVTLCLFAIKWLDCCISSKCSNITTLRLKEKAAGQSARFDPAKATSSSWVSVIFGNQLRFQSLGFRRCDVDILFDRRRTAEQLKLELKIYHRRRWAHGVGNEKCQTKVCIQRRGLSCKNLKREAESISYEYLLKRQRIYSADNISLWAC